MDMQVTLPPIAETIAPMFMTSTTKHGGTGLLQRAICSSQNGICYGDNLFEETLSLIEWASSAIRHHQQHSDIEKTHLESSLAREPKGWMPELAPPFDIYISSLFSTIYNLPHSAQQFAYDQGRSVWGMSRPEVAAPLMTDLLAIFPKATAIFIHRNPFDCARDMFRENPGSDLGAFCDQWNTLMRSYLEFSTDRLLKIPYEDAVNFPDVFCSSLEQFSGIQGINKELLSWDSEAEYLSNQNLTEEQLSTIAAECESMLAVYYPTLDVSK